MAKAKNDKAAAGVCLEVAKLEKEKFRLGHTKVFFRAGILGYVEEVREDKIGSVLSYLQAGARGKNSRLAYKKLIRMNMPVDTEGKVNFTTTLFALIRENLSIKMRSAEEMDQADVELRETIMKLWPLTGRNKIDLLVPSTPCIGRGKLTVGKIYGGLLILENWKQTKFGTVNKPEPLKVSLMRTVMDLYLSLSHLECMLS